VWGSLRTAACGYPPWLIDRGLQLGLRPRSWARLVTRAKLT